MSSPLFNIDAEKPLLAAIIRRPELLADCPDVRESDFSPAVNRVVFSMIRATLASGVEFSKFVLIDRLNSLNVKLGGVMEPANYINALELLKVSDKAAIGLAKEVKRTTFRRELNQIGQSIVDLTSKDKHKKAADLLAEVTKTFNDHVNIIEGSKENEPKDLYGSMGDFIDTESAFDTRSIPTPFPIYNDMYGFMDPGNIYTVCARAKVGKSTWLLSMMQQLAEADKNDEFIGLMLDTELTTDEVQSRALAALSGVREFHIRHRTYRHNKAMRDKVEEAREKLKPLWAKVDHLYIGGWDLETQLSAVRRWTAKKVTPTGKRCLVALDYFKLGSNADFNSKNPLFMTIGAKVDAYKRLTKELSIPLWAFVQANREQEDSKAGHKVVNGNAVSGSDMISQFSSNVYILQKLTNEERVALNQLSPDAATHSLINIYPRQLGPDERGQHRMVKWKDEKGKERWCENYLLYSFNNFRVREVGTFQDIVGSAQIIGAAVQPKAVKTPELL